MLVFAPIKWASTAMGAGIGGNRNQEIHMLGNVARWGHNVLLVGTGLLTIVVFYYLIK
jgi:hypothetical protein